MLSTHNNAAYKFFVKVKKVKLCNLIIKIVRITMECQTMQANQLLVLLKKCLVVYLFSFQATNCLTTLMNNGLDQVCQTLFKTLKMFIENLANQMNISEQLTSIIPIYLKVKNVVLFYLVCVEVKLVKDLIFQMMQHVWLLQLEYLFPKCTTPKLFLNATILTQKLKMETIQVVNLCCLEETGTHNRQQEL